MTIDHMHRSDRGDARACGQVDAASARDQMTNTDES